MAAQARLCFTPGGGLRLEQPTLKADFDEGFPAVKMEEPVAEEPPKKRARAKSTARCSLEARGASPAPAPADAEAGPPMTHRERQRARKARAKAKSTPRRSVDSQSSPVIPSEESMMMSKRPPAPESVPDELGPMTPDGKRRTGVIDVESAVKVKEEPKQALLTMNATGSMSLVSGKTKKDKLRGPAIGGDFRRGRNSKKVVARLPEFRSRASMYRAVWEGRYKKTSSGLEKKDLCVSVTGKIVPKRRSEQCRAVATANGWLDHWRDWTSATKIARDQLGIKSGFVKVKKNGTDEEMALYASIVTHYDKKASARKNRRRAGKKAAEKEGAGLEKEKEAGADKDNGAAKERETESEKDKEKDKEKEKDVVSLEAAEAEAAVGRATPVVAEAAEVPSPIC